MEKQVQPVPQAFPTETGSDPIQLPQGPSATVQQVGLPQSLDQTAGPISKSADLNLTGSLKTGGSVFVSVPVTAIPSAPSIPPVLQHVPDISSKLDTFWLDQMANLQNIPEDHWKNPEFPLARIKKIMRMDEEVRMISAEVPVMFSKAVEIFIAELSMRAWQHTEESKRRTIQRSDIAMAITKNDMFDFLIDIVPREEIQVKPKPHKCVESSGENLQLLPPDLLQMYIQHLTASATGEEGASNVLQNQLQILQQLLHIQQLQEQPHALPPSTSSQSEPNSTLLPTSTAPGAILDTQVLQASDTTTISTEILEQIRNQAMITSGEYQVLQRLSATDLLNTSTTMQQPEVSSSHPVDTAALNSRTQFQMQPTESVSIQHQLDSLTSQALHAVNPFGSSASETAMAQLPTEFGSSVDEGQLQGESSGVVTSTIPISQPPSNPVAFKSTPLRLTHVHGSSSLVELSDDISSTNNS